MFGDRSLVPDVDLLAMLDLLGVHLGQLVERRRAEDTSHEVHVRADGARFPVELTITRIDVPGEPTFTGQIRDITEDDPANARELLEEAATDLGDAITELRELARGIHPRGADRGRSRPSAAKSRQA